VLIADAEGRLVFANACLHALAGRTADSLGGGMPVETLFDPPAPMAAALELLRHGQPHWRGEAALAVPGAGPLPVAVRAETVPGRHGKPLGIVVTLFDLRDNKRAAEARRHLEASLQNAMSAAANLRSMQAPGGATTRAPDPLLASILTHASLAAMDFSDHVAAAPVAPMLEQLEASTRRATQLYGRIRGMARPPEDAADG
jgi:hypothetical protein